MDQENAGIFKIKDGAIKSIAAIAAREVEGVWDIKKGPIAKVAGVFGKNTVFCGIKVAVKENEMKISMSIIAKYGANLPLVAGNVQDKVKSEIEKMTGLTNIEVNVNIQDVIREDAR